jgi:hypothetical protein
MAIFSIKARNIPGIPFFFIWNPWKNVWGLYPKVIKIKMIIIPILEMQ